MEISNGIWSPSESDSELIDHPLPSLNATGSGWMLIHG
jgi:hypothetical protein